MIDQTKKMLSASKHDRDLHLQLPLRELLLKPSLQTFQVIHLHPNLSYYHKPRKVMPTGALTISIPDSPATTTRKATKHSLARPTFFPTIAWWKLFPRPFGGDVYRDGGQERNYRAEEGLLDGGRNDEFSVGNGVIGAGRVGSGVGMMRGAGSDYWRGGREQSEKRGKIRVLGEGLWAVGAVVAMVGLIALIVRG